MSSISSRSLSMSSLIFLPFLESSTLPLPPSPSWAGSLALPSFFFCCSGISLSVPSAFNWPRERQRHRLWRTIPSHLCFALPSPYVVTGKPGDPRRDVPRAGENETDVQLLDEVDEASSAE